MKGDPCFRCSLPECDERSPRCAVRQLSKQYEAYRRRGEAHLAPEEARTAATTLFNFWKLDRAAEASEGGRPFRRGNTVYGPEGGDAR